MKKLIIAAAFISCLGCKNAYQENTPEQQTRTIDSLRKFKDSIMVVVTASSFTTPKDLAQDKLIADLQANVVKLLASITILTSKNKDQDALITGLQKKDTITGVPKRTIVKLISPRKYAFDIDPAYKPNP